MTVREKLLRFNKSVKKTEELRRELGIDAIRLCAGYERGLEGRTTVQMIHPCMDIVAATLEQPVTVTIDDSGMTRTLDFGGVRYFEWKPSKIRKSEGK